MRVKVRTIGEGLHPSEIVIEVKTFDGAERLVVDKRSVSAGSISVGAPLRRDRGRELVELPRETTNGLWRVWVKSDSLSPDIAGPGTRRASLPRADCGQISFER